MATFLFFILNTIVIIVIFITTRIGAVSWELVLTKKHNNDLENFMIILALFFAAAYAGAMAFSFDDLNLANNYLHLLGTVFFFMCMNIAILISTTILMVYLVSSFKKKSRIMLGIFLLINSSLFVYEVISFDIAYKKSLEVKKITSCCSLCKK